MKKNRYLELYSNPKIAQFMEGERDQKLIAVKRAYVNIADDLVVGLVLNQIVFWSTPNAFGEIPLQIERDGHVWLAKTREDWYDECWISPTQVDRALNVLKQKGLIEVARYKWRGAPTLHLRLIWENFIPAWEASVANPLPSKTERRARRTSTKLSVVVKSREGDFKDSRNSRIVKIRVFRKTLKSIFTKPEEPTYIEFNKKFNERVDPETTREKNSAEENFRAEVEPTPVPQTPKTIHPLPQIRISSNSSVKTKVPPVDEKINTPPGQGEMLWGQEFPGLLKTTLSDRHLSNREKGLKIVRALSEDPWLDKAARIPSTLSTEMRLGGALLPWKELDKAKSQGGYSMAFLSHILATWKKRYKKSDDDQQTSAAISHVRHLEETLGGWTQLMAYWDEMEMLERKRVHHLQVLQASQVPTPPVETEEPPVERIPDTELAKIRDRLFSQLNANNKNSPGRGG